MSSAIEILWKQAKKTFGGRRSVGYRFCEKNFDKLRAIMDGMEAEDVKIDKQVLQSVERQFAPMCVMDVYEDFDITIAIFLLKHGASIPLHDHPGMHGLLKVLCGAVKVSSYTVKNMQEHSMQLGDETPAVRHPSVTVRSGDPACVLMPEERNFHEISCVEGTAVFLDILSPSYILTPQTPDVSHRPCTFFREIARERSGEESSDAGQVQLVATTKPPEFYANFLQYRGLPLK